MSHQDHNTTTVSSRIRGWFASPDGFAAAAAGGGDPAPILTLQRYRRAQADRETIDEMKRS
jgi:hypothetical protein